MDGWERSCWWPVGLVLLEGKTWLNCMRFSVVGFFFFSWRTSQASHRLSTAGICTITVAWCKVMGEKVSTGGSWQTLLKPLAKCSRLTPRPSLPIMPLVELVSFPASHFYNRLITACIGYSWNSPLQLTLWKCTVDCKKVGNIKQAARL